MIQQETIDKVYALDIVEVVSRYVELKDQGVTGRFLSVFKRTFSFVYGISSKVYTSVSVR
jgi:DNA primase